MPVENSKASLWGKPPHPPLQRSSVLPDLDQTPTPQAARAAPSERKSGCTRQGLYLIGNLGAASLACYDFWVAEGRSESMKKRISITACRHAILITERGYDPGIPLEIDSEDQLVTSVEIRGGRWYSGDHRLTRGQQEKLTERAYAIIDNDRQPRVAPNISIRDCQKAIRIAGGIRISLRGKEQLITEVKTGGAGNSRWFSGSLRFTSTEQQLLTSVARTILAEARETMRQLPLPYSQ